MSIKIEPQKKAIITRTYEKKKKILIHRYDQKKKDINTSRIYMGITSRFDRINVRCASILLGQTRTAK